MDRFVTVWNSFAGVAGFRADLKPVKKFENRAKAVARIWNPLQRLNADLRRRRSRRRNGQSRAHECPACAVEGQLGEEGHPG
jgi:hypothetical protein